MTSLGDRLREAGMETSSDKLDRFAREAWEHWPAKDAGAMRRKHMAGRLSGDPTWELIRRWRSQALAEAVGWMLLQAKPKEHDAGDVPAGGGQIDAGNQPGCAPATSSRDAARSQAERRSEPAISGTTPNSAVPAAPTLTELADKQAAAARVRVTVALRLSRLDTFVVNGRPIGDLTPEEARGWASSRERDARFVRMLIANLPPNRPIREFVRGQEADELYQRAEAEHAS